MWRTEQAPTGLTDAAQARWRRATGLPRLIALALSLAVGSTVAALLGATPAHAHAVFLGASPANGATISRLPERVEVRVARKEATLEGDPLRVYDPAGARIDLGDPRVEDGGNGLSVGLAPHPDTPGSYHVVYRLVSADSHIITDHLTFAIGTATAPTEGVDDAVASSGLAGADLRPGHLQQAHASALPLMGGAAAVLVAIGLVVGRRRRRVPAPVARAEPVAVGGRR